MTDGYNPPHPFTPETIEPLREAEKALVERTLALFSRADEDVGTATMPPTYDEFVASLPDGLPGDGAAK